MEEIQDFKAIPVYRETSVYARKHDELEQYRASGKANQKCKFAIEQIIRENFDGMRLPKDIAKTILDTFGTERVSYVLANTLQTKSWDGRFGRDNLEWAQTIPLKPDLADEINKNVFCVVETHPAVLDGFIRHVRKMLEERERPRLPLAEQLKRTTQNQPARKPERPRNHGMER